MDPALSSARMIRLTHYGVKIDGSSLGADQWNYESEVSILLDAMSNRSVGAALLRGVSTHGVRVTITPHPRAECDARGGWSAPGVGFVTFTPRDFMSRSPLGCNHANSAGADPREILFHELVHALRGIAGKWRDGRVGGLNKTFTGDEEFIAIMLTNIYSSERGRKTRESHEGFVPLSQTSESTVMSAAKITLIEVVKQDHPEMFQRIARSSAKYNPLRLYASY